MKGTKNQSKRIKILCILFLSIFFIGNGYGQIAESDTTCQMPDNITLDKAISTLWAGSCFQVDSNRHHALNIIQCAANHLSHTQYNSYLQSEQSVGEDETGLLRFYQHALEKIIHEVKTETPAGGTIIMWYLYNMGYVIKTPTCCFGIDIKHKNSEKLVELLDFLLISHRHGDHFDEDMVKAMERSNKPVVSNFIENRYLVTEPVTLSFDEVEIKILINDHNARTPNFVLSFEIDCGKSTDHMIVFHTGDSYMASQLLTTNDVDILIPHSRVGLNINDVVKNTRAKKVLMSHVMELAHSRFYTPGGYRMTYASGFEECDKIINADACLPVWGEKIVMEFNVF